MLFLTALQTLLNVALFTLLLRSRREWILENKAGRPVLNASRRHGRETLIEEVGGDLRKMMPWLKTKNS